MGLSASMVTAADAASIGHKASEHVEIILVDWAAHPLYRNKLIDGRIVRCGLGRMLEEMSRHDPGIDINVTLIVNAGTPPVADGARRQSLLLGGLQRVVDRQRERRIEQRTRAYALLPEKYPFIKAVHVRDNHGFDLGAYDFGYQLLREQGYRGDVLFSNASVAGPYEHGWLLKYRGQFRRHPKVGLCGIGLNSHDTSVGDGPFAPHVQSYFVYTNMGVLEDAIGAHLLGADADDELDVIRRGEIGMSDRVLDAGYSITSPVFPEFAYRRGDPWAIPWGDLRYGKHQHLGLPINTI